MAVYRRILLGVIFSGVLSIPTFAAESMLGSLLIVWPNGTTTTVPILDAKMLDMAMQDAKPTTGATMVMIQGGKAYLVPDRKMDNGKMMSESFSRPSPFGTGPGR